MNFKNFKRHKIRILDLCRSLQLNVGVVGLYGRWRQRRLLAASWTSRTTEVCRRCFPMQTPRSRLTQITPVSRSNLSYVSPRRFLTLRCSCAAEGLRYRLRLTGVTETMEVYLGLCIIGTARAVCDGRGVRLSVCLSQHGPPEATAPACSRRMRAINQYSFIKLTAWQRPTTRSKKASVSKNKKLSYRRVTARCVVSVVILPIATQQYWNYLHDKSWPNRWYEVGDSVAGNAW